MTQLFHLRHILNAASLQTSFQRRTTNHPSMPKRSRYLAQPATTMRMMEIGRKVAKMLLNSLVHPTVLVRRLGSHHKVHSGIPMIQVGVLLVGRSPRSRIQPSRQSQSLSSVKSGLHFVLAQHFPHPRSRLLDHRAQFGLCSQANSLHRRAPAF